MKVKVYFPAFYVTVLFCLIKMHKYKRLDFIDTDLKPALLESVEGLRGNLETTRDTFTRQCDRLAVVRVEKETRRMEMIGRHKVESWAYWLLNLAFSLFMSSFLSLFHTVYIRCVIKLSTVKFMAVLLTF